MGQNMSVCLSNVNSSISKMMFLFNKETRVEIHHSSFYLPFSSELTLAVLLLGESQPCFLLNSFQKTLFDQENIYILVQFGNGCLIVKGDWAQWDMAIGKNECGRYSSRSLIQCLPTF